jgi:hypothetical protein
MSYTFLPGPEGVSSAASFSDIPPSVLSRLNLTAEKSCCSGSEMESSHDSQSGTMCVHSMERPGGDSLTSLRVDFHARTYPQPEKERVLTAHAQDSGERWLGSLARYDPDSRSWKTAQCLLQGGLEEFLETWPKWGMMRDGVCWEQEMSACLTSESEYGYWPTPCATDYKGSRTPEALARAGRNERNNLRDFMRNKGQWLYPPAKVVELLMGWPIGWTDLQPLAMDKFQAWRHSHGAH